MTEYYHHLDSSRIFAQLGTYFAQHGKNLDDATKKRMIRARYTPQKFYEGTIVHRGRDALFFLQKPIPDERTFDRVFLVMLEAFLGSRYYSRFQEKNRLGNEHYDLYQRASTLFEKYEIPKDLWGRRDLAIAHALHTRFAEQADIVVPGYVAGISIDRDGAVISAIDVIPHNERERLEALLREHHLKGPLTFWDLQTAQRGDFP